MPRSGQIHVAFRMQELVFPTASPPVAAPSAALFWHRCIPEPSLRSSRQTKAKRNDRRTRAACVSATQGPQLGEQLQPDEAPSGASLSASPGAETSAQYPVERMLPSICSTQTVTESSGSSSSSSERWLQVLKLHLLWVQHPPCMRFGVHQGPADGPLPLLLQWSRSSRKQWSRTRQ